MDRDGDDERVRILRAGDQRPAGSSRLAAPHLLLIRWVPGEEAHVVAGARRLAGSHEHDRISGARELLQDTGDNRM
jgi:hypothetical protein